ncbi:MAG: cytochrome b/b6 domain-containing protein [Rhodospirillales bacterium]|nr:cytochrome b/b6 domain-containing protein [Rhodospirillales bacterium]
MPDGLKPATGTKGATRVWDLPTRIFHWSLVALIATGLLSGYFAPAWWLDIHSWAGYGIAGLIIFRLVWAVFGFEYSRFSNFTYAPGETLRHLRSFLRRQPGHYTGHNPLGAMMVFALIAVISGIVVSGLVSLGGKEDQGPLATVASYSVGKTADDIHEILAGILVGLIGLHIGGVLVESILSRENLVRSMISGWKTRLSSREPAAPRPARPRAALAVFAVAALLIGSAFTVLAGLPATGLTTAAAHPAFEAECSDCHQLYHPSLLPAASWRDMMASLDQHFGEDASLDDGDRTSITGHLVKHAAGHWDSKAAHKFRTISEQEPWQISATPGWKRIHKEIPEADFKRPKVKSKSNCLGCHSDAASGRFHNQNIRLPKE